MELHVRTRKRLRADPEFDAICAIFYHIEHEGKQEKEHVTGVIVVRHESTKLRNPDEGTSGVTKGIPGVSKGRICFKIFTTGYLQHYLLF